MDHQHGGDTENKGSISLSGGVAMGTGVMIGAGIFALTGQIAQLAGPLFPLAFVVGGIITSFSAYSYVKMSNAFPSSGGIASSAGYLRGMPPTALSSTGVRCRRVGDDRQVLLSAPRCRERVNERGVKREGMYSFFC